MAYNKEDVVRLSLAVSHETNDKLEKWSSYMKLSKTKLINLIIDNYLEVFVSSWEMLKNPDIFDGIQKLASLANNEELMKNLSVFANEKDNNTVSYNKADNFINELSNK